MQYRHLFEIYVPLALATGIITFLNEIWHFLSACRLLSVESVDENGKPQLYLVFEYLDSDLKKFIDSYGRGSGNPIPAKTIQVPYTDQDEILSF